MATKGGIVAKRYAKALFELCEPASFDSVRKGLNTVAELWEQSTEFRAAVFNPTTSEEEKLLVMQDIAEKVLPANEKIKNFFSLLARNGRISDIKDISEVFSSLVDQAKELLSLEILSAFPLPDSEREEIQTRIQKDFGSMASITWSVDPELLGGLLVKAGDRQLDGSVRGSLEKLRIQLTG